MPSIETFLLWSVGSLKGAWATVGLGLVLVTMGRAPRLNGHPVWRQGEGGGPGGFDFLAFLPASASASFSGRQLLRFDNVPRCSRLRSAAPIVSDLPEPRDRAVAGWSGRESPRPRRTL